MTAFGYLETAMVALDTRATKLNGNKWHWLAVQFQSPDVSPWIRGGATGGEFAHNNNKKGRKRKKKKKRGQK